LIEGIIGRLNMQGRLTSIPQRLIKGDPAPAEDDRLFLLNRAGQAFLIDLIILRPIWPKHCTPDSSPSE